MYIVYVYSLSVYTYVYIYIYTYVLHIKYDNGVSKEAKNISKIIESNNNDNVLETVQDMKNNYEKLNSMFEYVTKRFAEIEENLTDEIESHICTANPMMWHCVTPNNNYQPGNNKFCDENNQNCTYCPAGSACMLKTPSNLHSKLCGPVKN